MVADQLVGKSKGEKMNEVGKTTPGKAHQKRMTENDENGQKREKCHTGKGAHHSHDDQLVSMEWLESHIGKLEPEAGSKRARSTGPDSTPGSPPREKGMYYKIDPKLMTGFMENVRQSQREIQETITRQNSNIIAQERTQREQTESMIENAMTAIDKKFDLFDQKLRARQYEEKISEKLGTTDPHAQWRLEVDQTMNSIKVTLGDQQRLTEMTDLKIGNTNEQVSAITNQMSELSSIIPKIMDIERTMKSNEQQSLNSTPNPELSSLTNMMANIGNQISEQSRQLQSHQSESRETVKKLSERQDSMFEKMRDCVREIKLEQETFKMDVPALIRKELSSIKFAEKIENNSETSAGIHKVDTAGEILTCKHEQDHEKKNTNLKSQGGQDNRNSNHHLRRDPSIQTSSI